MTNIGMPGGIVPNLSTNVWKFMAAVDALCPTIDDEVPVEALAAHLGWPVAAVVATAEWCRDKCLIDTDAGIGDPIRFIEGRHRFGACGPMLSGSQAMSRVEVHPKNCRVSGGDHRVALELNERRVGEGFCDHDQTASRAMLGGAAFASGEEDRGD